ncbi:zinc finger BED domain-containing protein 5 [Carassius carassius]|uniref:zinc finger BED domain-containing protein 5 n=1 Tax=Carassius carassius TaxID=217509 RepID=UPI002868AE30|nr:zinc finger BED domain-containing protein 5 [Carassius carassius]
MTRIMCGEKAAKELNLVPLSNDTVSRRIKEMADDVKKTLIERIQSSQYFAIQLDKNTDVTDLANLLVYVRYEKDGSAHEDFMFCQSLGTRTTAEHIFQVLDAFIQENGLDWKKCVGVCTDGARAMTGRHSGVAARIREVAPEMRRTHCSIHREALAVKKMPGDLKSVLDSAVNFIKARPMNSRLFCVLCEEMGSEHVQLLLHTEVQWLSRGKVLSRLFELHKEVHMFLQDTNFPLSDIFEDTVWLSQLAYLSDIFSHLNELNLGLQGLSINVFDVQDKINALLKKLELFEIKIKTGDVSAFPALESFLSDNDLTLDGRLRDNITAHLVSLRQQFLDYFPVMPEAEASRWMRNPFSINTSQMASQDLTVGEQESLIELSCDETLKVAFRTQTLLDFWIKQHSEYPVLSDKALRFLLPFVTTYLCEKGFSLLVVIKTKYRSRVDAEPNLRLKLTSIDPDISGLCSQRHAHPSH